MKPFRLTAAVLATSLTLGAGVASTAAASTITGNPALDGWEFQGNSLDAGVFVRGNGGWNYDVYTQEFILAAGNPLFNISSSWQAGDIVLGMGGVSRQTSDITLRTVSKFGGASSGFQAAVPGPGVGSTAQGGVGTVLSAFQYTRTGPSGQKVLQNPAWNGALLTPATFRYVSGSSTVNYDSNADVTDYARIIALFDGVGDSTVSDTVVSWQSFLNISAMERDLFFADGTPARGAPSIVTWQRGTGASVDALASVSPIPLPAAGWLLLGGLGALGFAARRKRKMVA